MRIFERKEQMVVKIHLFIHFLVHIVLGLFHFYPRPLKRFEGIVVVHAVRLSVANVSLSTEHRYGPRVLILHQNVLLVIALIDF